MIDEERGHRGISSALPGTGLPRLTVVIPVYNAEKWLPETLGSVLAQNYPQERYEIIVVDDGSKDCSIAVAREVLDGARVSYQLIEIGKTTGPSHARNLGWRRGTGSWIQFLDADDLLHPEKMSIQAQAAASLSEEVAVAYSGWQSLDRVELKWLPVESVNTPMVDADPISALLQSDGFIATGSQIVRRTWLERVGGFDERHTLIEDVDLMLRIAMAGGEFHRVETDQPLFFYRRGLTGSLSQLDTRAFLEGCVRNAELVESYCRRNQVLTSARAQAIASVYLFASRNFIELDRGRFEQLARQLESMSPRFRPSDPAYLRWLSRLLGYRKAERLSWPLRKAYRKLRMALPRGR